MISRSSLAHVRVPLSFYLLPIFLCALLAMEKIDVAKAWVVFIALHFFLYPASNGFNSYYDRDSESIGTLKRPPPVEKDLLWFSLALDAAALVLSLWVGLLFTCGLFVLGFFPLTQVFQHREDARRHDTTISMRIGIRGTFILAAAILLVAFSVFFFYFKATLGMKYAGVFFILLFPAAVSFLRWFGRIFKDTGAADYDHATRICLLASGGMNIFFLMAIVLSKTE